MNFSKVYVIPMAQPYKKPTFLTRENINN